MGRVCDVLTMLVFGLVLVLLGLVEFSPTPWANDLLVGGGLLTLAAAVWIAAAPAGSRQ
jgi:hypothetical protein